MRLVHRPVPPHQPDQRRCHHAGEAGRDRRARQPVPERQRADSRARRASRPSRRRRRGARGGARLAQDRLADAARRQRVGSGAWRSASRSQASCSASFIAILRRDRLEVRAHARAQLAHRVAQARLRGLEADLERARDLVERQAVVVMEQEGAALRQRQLLEAVQQLLAGAAPERELVALRRGAGRRRPVLPGRGVGLPRLVAVALERVDRDLAAAPAQQVDRRGGGRA